MCKKHEKEIIFVCKDCFDEKICQGCITDHSAHNLLTLDNYIRDGKMYHGCHKINNILKSLHQYQRNVIAKDSYLLKELPSTICCIIEEKQTANIKKLEMIKKCISRITTFIQLKENFNDEELNDTSQILEKIENILPNVDNLDFKNNEYEGKLFMNLKNMLLSKELNDPKNVNLNYAELLQNFDKILTSDILYKISKNLSSIDYLHFSSERSINIQNIVEIFSVCSHSDGFIYMGVYAQNTLKWAWLGYLDNKRSFAIWKVNEKTLKPVKKFQLNELPNSIIEHNRELYVGFKSSVQTLNESLEIVLKRKNILHSIRQVIPNDKNSLIFSTNNSIEKLSFNESESSKTRIKTLLNSVHFNGQICNWKENSLALLVGSKLIIYKPEKEIIKTIELRNQIYFNRKVLFSSILSINNDFLVISEYNSKTLTIFYNVEDEPQIYKLDVRPRKIWHIESRKEIWINNGVNKLIALSYAH
ncbi:unnamed protein product [Dimorphilus gyrociliatus]|uniref:Uncharacterized protein n=1 Tax=Dimorphilus gyrociliatus TaxID=2664684 RepID=A0A7I8W9P2_9ANNE|nr:unnamed protein product [Dimorphilus gyrociliatus]